MRAVIGVLALVVQFGLLVCCVEIIYYLRRAVIGSEPFRDRRLALAEEQLAEAREQQEIELVLEEEIRKVRKAITDDSGVRTALAK